MNPVFYCKDSQYCIVFIVIHWSEESIKHQLTPQTIYLNKIIIDELSSFYKTNFNPF